MRKILIATLLSATAASAQVEQRILEDLQRDFGGVDGVPERGPVTSRLQVGAMLRGLDKMTGRAVDIPVMAGETVTCERLSILLDACRIPAEGETQDAYAFVEIQDSREEDPRFAGWMIASSPALNAMDHPRYDIWVTDCIDAMPDDTAGSEPVEDPVPEPLDEETLPDDG